MPDFLLPVTPDYLDCDFKSFDELSEESINYCWQKTHVAEWHLDIKVK